MYNYLLINATPYEIRIALVEHGNLVEFYQERPVEKGLVGNIYQGRVVRVLPGMQAAFVDLGLERTGFLYVDDVRTDNRHYEDSMISDGCQSCCDDTPEVTQKGIVAQVNIEDLLTELDKDFHVCNKPYESCEDGLLYHTILTRKESELKVAGEYMGGVEIITNSKNQIKTVMMFKP